MTQPSTEDISTKVEALRDPRVFPEEPEDVDVIETHKSWVFLAGEHVYKLKKPVRFNSVDHRQLADRYGNCQEEVRLNRRLAPEIYLGVAPLTMGNRGEIRVAGSGEPIDWLVKMRRLPADKTLDRSIERDRVKPHDVQNVVNVLVDFYRREQPMELSANEYRASIDKELVMSRSAMVAAEDHDFGVDGVSIVDRLSAFLDEEQPMFDVRVSAGRVVEGHGDLRSSHVYLIEPRPVIIDCLEFERELRIVDPIDELGFLALECERDGVDWIGRMLFKGYRQQTGDDFPERLVDFYKAYRATTWARLAIWRLQEYGAIDPEKWISRARSYLMLARSYEQSSLLV